MAAITAITHLVEEEGMKEQFRNPAASYASYFRKGKFEMMLVESQLYSMVALGVGDENCDPAMLVAVAGIGVAFEIAQAAARSEDFAILDENRADYLEEVLVRERCSAVDWIKSLVPWWLSWLGGVGTDIKIDDKIRALVEQYFDIIQPTADAS